MSRAISLLAALVALAALVDGLPAPFPRGSVAVYKYYGDVKAGLIEPAPYASQFAIEGFLHVKHDTSDVSLKNAYHVVLRDVKSGLHNGIAAHYERAKVLTPISEPGKIIQQPFLIIYDETGRLSGVKISENEPGWSRNMKMAMASTLQLDFPNVRLDEGFEPRSFVTPEKTIFGECWISYDVRAKDPLATSPSEFVVTKFSSPKNCSGFAVREFDQDDEEICQVSREEPVNVASRRVFEIEKQDEDVVIKKLVAHGGANYFPWNARSEAHYVLNNATFILDRLVPLSEWDLGTFDFAAIPKTLDLTYQKPRKLYAPNAAVDATQGRRTVDQNVLVQKLGKMLGEAADYLEENHLNPEEPDWKHGQTINRILQTMSYMTLESFKSVFESLSSPENQRDETAKNIFLDMIPHVGTLASSLFVYEAIESGKVSSDVGSEMLMYFSKSIREPSEELLVQMQGLTNLKNSKNPALHLEGILAFSTLIYRTFKNTDNPDEHPLVKKYLDEFFNMLQTSEDDLFKMTYLMAMRNMRFGKIDERLAPIIRGKTRISEDPVGFRLLAIWAIEKSVEGDYDRARELLWPVMSDLSLPVKLRIAAYDILMRQATKMSHVLNLYWFMVYERNEHLYNYHHTSIKSIANTVDQCRPKLRELVRKIMRFTRIHDHVRYPVSSTRTYDYKDEKYGFAEKFRGDAIFNEITGSPEVLRLDVIQTTGRKPVATFDLRIHVKGLDVLKNDFMSINPIDDKKIQDILEEVSQDLPSLSKTISVDLVVLQHGHVTQVHHMPEMTVMNFLGSIIQTAEGLPQLMSKKSGVNHQSVIYRNLYEMQVVSDMGLPVLFEKRIPLVFSLLGQAGGSGDNDNFQLDLELKFNAWSHGDYSMSVYNPMADVWHSVRRATAIDVSIPIQGSVSFNRLTGALGASFPVLPANRFSETGFLSHAKDCVTVNEDDSAALKASCPTCKIQEVVSLGPQAKKSHRASFESRTTGLEYSAAIFDCENGLTPVKLSQEYNRALIFSRKNDWNVMFNRVYMAARQFYFDLIISPTMGSCGTLLKIQPSITHPTSRVDLEMRQNLDDVMKVSPFLYDDKKYSLRGSMNAIAAGTNVSSRSWDLNLNVDLNKGHLVNSVKAHLTRITPGETNLRVCIEAQKTYTKMPNDLLEVGVTPEETNSKLTIISAHTNEDTCPRDEHLFSIVVKGEHSDEQKKKFLERNNGACARDSRDPLLSNPKNSVPITPDCLNEAIMFTTMRKYSLDVTEKNISSKWKSRINKFVDSVRASFLPNLQYTDKSAEDNNTRITVEFPLTNNQFNVSVTTPSRAYDLVDVSFAKERFNGFGPIIRPEWFFPLDNTRFNPYYLQRYTNYKIKICSIFPEAVITGDGSKVPFSLDDKWTLVSGDIQQKTFAIFARKNANKIDLKVAIRGYVVTLKANEKDELFKDSQYGSLIPDNVGLIKMSRLNDNMIIQMRRIPVMLAYNENYVTLLLDVDGLQGRTGGLCGSLSGSQTSSIKKSYKLEST